MLEASLNSLRDGGHFVGTIFPFEKLSVTPDMAERLGYMIIRYRPSEFVLQKP